MYITSKYIHNDYVVPQLYVHDIIFDLLCAGKITKWLPYTYVAIAFYSW